MCLSSLAMVLAWTIGLLNSSLYFCLNIDSETAHYIEAGIKTLFWSTGYRPLAYAQVEYIRAIVTPRPDRAAVVAALYPLIRLKGVGCWINSIKRLGRTTGFY